MEEQQRIQYSLKIAGGILAVIWAAHLIQWFSPLDFTHWGILPLRTEGLRGILFAPFLHSQDNWGHIINNSPSLFAGIVMLYYFYPTVAHRSLLFIYLFSGMAVWVIAGFSPDSKFAYHIGASGVLYGLISFIFFSGVFRKNPRATILALIMVMMYSGMVVGLFPDGAGKISWQSHLAGAAFGMLLAYQFRNMLEVDERFYLNGKKKIRNEGRETPFLPSDTFEVTRQEREWLEGMREDGA